MLSIVLRYMFCVDWAFLGVLLALVYPSSLDHRSTPVCQEYSLFEYCTPIRVDARKIPTPTPAIFLSLAALTFSLAKFSLAEFSLAKFSVVVFSFIIQESCY